MGQRSEPVTIHWAKGREVSEKAKHFEKAVSPPVQEQNNEPREPRKPKNPALELNPPGPGGHAPSVREAPGAVSYCENQAAEDVLSVLQEKHSGLSFDESKVALQRAFSEVNFTHIDANAQKAQEALRAKQANRREELSKQHEERREDAYSRIDQKADIALQTAATPREIAQIQDVRKTCWEAFDSKLEAETSALEETERQENEGLQLDIANSYQTGQVLETGQGRDAGKSMSKEGGMEL